MKSKHLNTNDLLKSHMTQIKVNYTYEVLLLLLKKEMHGRELAKELKTSLTRVQSILTELREINVLDYNVLGKNHLYFIKKNLVSKSFVLNAENYKIVNIIRKNPELEPIFQNIIKKSKANLILLLAVTQKEIKKRTAILIFILIQQIKKSKMMFKKYMI